MTEAPVDGVLLAVLDLLEREGIRYAVLGGLAVNVWAVPRATFDIDLGPHISRREAAWSVGAMRSAQRIAREPADERRPANAG